MPHRNLSVAVKRCRTSPDAALYDSARAGADLIDGQDGTNALHGDELTAVGFIL